MFAKKNLVAAAALLAIAGTAQAQLKVYGLLDVSVGSFEFAHAPNLSSRTTQVSSGNMTTSFLGFSGSEDLGGGLKAEFALETFLALDNGATLANNAGQFWGRASNIALSGGFGKVALGQYDNPLFTSGYTYNPFGSAMTFSPTMRHYGYLGQTGIAGAGVGFDTGWVNSITYESPNFSGFSFIAQYAPKESTTAGTKNSYAAAGTFAAGPFAITLTYVKGGKVAEAVPAGTVAAARPSAYTADERVWDLGTSYDFGVLKAFAQYTDIQQSSATSLFDTSVANPGAAALLGSIASNKDKIYQIGVSVPVTEKGAVLASYGELRNRAVGATTSTKDRIFSLAYDYTLSKRTDTYVAFMNNGQSNLQSGQTFAVGLRHNF